MILKWDHMVRRIPVSFLFTVSSSAATLETPPIGERQNDAWP